MSIGEVFKEGAKAVDKLGEIILKAFGPMWTKKQAGADDYAYQKQLDIIRNNHDMKIAFFNGEMYARECTQEELLRRAKNRQIFESVRQENNIESVLNYAALEAARQPDSEVSDEIVDDDWVTRFFDIVKNINGEELQLVWGRILAGEIKKPGSFSFRTLDVIRNISRAEAEIFQKVMPFALVSGESLVLPNDEETLSKYNINYHMLMRLDESGLLNINGTTSVTGEVGKGPSLIAQIGFYYFIANAKSSNMEKYHFGIYPFTKAGKELYGILSHDVDESYLKAIARKMRNTNRGISITLFKGGEADGTGHVPFIAVDID